MFHRMAGSTAVVASLFFFSPNVASAQPATTWEPAASANYQASSGRTIDMIVIHKAESSLSAAVNTFQNPSSKVSAHYIVSDAEAVQLVRDQDIAWHAGNAAYNHRSIGIENEGFNARDDMTDAHYQRLAQLVAYLCGEYGIPIDRHHIIGHAEVPDPNHPGEFGGAGHHTCPGPYWDWSLFMSYVQQFAGGAPAPTPSPTPSPTPTPAPAPSADQGVTITASSLNVRDAAGGNVIGQADQGSGYVLTGNSNQGYVEIYWAGQTAWIDSAYTQSYSGPGAQVTASVLNVRSGPGGSVVGQCYQGQVYASGSVSGSWTEIRWDENLRWVFTSYTTPVTLNP